MAVRYTRKNDAGETLTETCYQGCVLRLYRGDVRVMSDVWDEGLWAEVFDANMQTVKNILVRLYSSEHVPGEAEVDATHDVRLAVARMDARQRIEHELASQRAEHNRVEKGKVMRTTVTRGKNKGVQGEVFWLRDGRAGVRTSDRKDARGQWADVAWVDASKLEPVEPFTGAVDEAAFAVACDHCEAAGVEHGKAITVAYRWYRDGVVLPPSLPELLALGADELTGLCDVYFEDASALRWLLAAGERHPSREDLNAIVDLLRASCKAVAA